MGRNKNKEKSQDLGYHDDLVLGYYDGLVFTGLSPEDLDKEIERLKKESDELEDWLPL